MTKILLTMKTFLTLSVLLIFGSAFLTAQNINWSGLMKDNAGNALANTNVALIFSILEGPGETLVYRETHNATTGSSGLVSAEIGGGTVNAGTFANLDFTKPYKLRTEANSGNGNIILGVTEFKAVPLAKSANSAEAAKSAEKMQKGSSSVEIDNNNQILLKENGSTSVSIQNGKMKLPALAGNGVHTLQVTNDGVIEQKPVQSATDYYSVSASAINYPGYQFSPTEGFYNSNGTTSPRIYVPLNLPSGSLEKMTVEFLDKSVTTGFLVELFRVGQNPQAGGELIAEIASLQSFSSSSWQIKTTTINNNNKTINNQLYSYYISIREIGSWGTNKDLRLNKFVFEYKKND